MSNWPHSYTSRIEKSTIKIRSQKVIEEFYTYSEQSTIIHNPSHLKDVTGEVPTDWLKANVSTIIASNYRPISLTCVPSKLMEHILVSNIMKYAQSHNILYDLQHGFCSCVSRETQLIKFTHDLVTNMQSGAQTDVIVMDFSKPFDKVSHTKLIGKLHHYGIQGKTHFWIKAF